MLNKYIAIGYLGRDPEFRNTATGQTVASFSFATTRYWKDKATGQKREDTFWIQCTAFSRMAEMMEKFFADGRLVKGTRIQIEGYMSTNKWQQQDGTPRERTVCTLENYQILDFEKRGDRSEEADPEQPRAARRQTAKTGTGFDDMDDDIPF